MMVKRILYDSVKEKIGRGKAIMLIGPRQVGKTTLFEEIAASLNDSPMLLNCDEPEVRALLEGPSAQQLKMLIGSHKAIIIDEAQRVDDIGLTMKRIVDNFKEIQVFATGSSSLHLRDRLNEPLTGRKYEFIMYPLSTKELYETYGLPKLMQMLEPRLIYGSYPEIVTHPSEAKDLLITLSDSYLYKDILSLDMLRRPQLLNNILKALALQIGSEVSYNELAKTVGSDPKTVEKYIDLLEKCFVIFRLNGFSRNLRNELKKSKKIYFIDNGVRNAILQNFAPTSLRDDMGALWENFFIAERIKYNQYRGYNANIYFWRTTTQQEIDFVEERDGMFTIFEMKWNAKISKVKFPETFAKNYPVASQHLVTPVTYLDYLM